MCIVHIIIIYTHNERPGWMPISIHSNGASQKLQATTVGAMPLPWSPRAAFVLRAGDSSLQRKRRVRRLVGKWVKFFFVNPWWNLLSTSTSTFFCTFFLVLIVLKKAGAEQAVLLANFPGSMEPMHGWANRSSLLAGTVLTFFAGFRTFHGMPRCLAQAWWPWLLHGRFRASWFQDCFKARPAQLWVACFLCLSLCSLARKTCFRWGVPTGGPDFRGNMKDGTGWWDDGMRLGISFCEDSTLEFTGEAGIETCYLQILPHDRDIRCPGACSPYVTYSRPLSEDLFFAACLRWILWLLWVQWPTQWLRFSTSRVHFILSVLKFIIWWSRQVHHGFTF